MKKEPSRIVFEISPEAQEAILHQGLAVVMTLTQEGPSGEMRKIPVEISDLIKDRIANVNKVRWREIFEPFTTPQSPEHAT